VYVYVYVICCFLKFAVGFVLLLWMCVHMYAAHRHIFGLAIAGSEIAEFGRVLGCRDFQDDTSRIEFRAEIALDLDFVVHTRLPMFSYYWDNLRALCCV
jgi:hypothetical protein